MGIKERKAREREAFRQLIISTAHDQLISHGLEGITMRGIADAIEYSQSKIYEFFKSKDELCEVLFEELVHKLFEIVKQIPKSLAPEKYLMEMITKTIEFHASYPNSEQLFTLVCYGPERFKITPAFFEMEKYPIEAVRNLKSPYIKTEDDIYEALDIIRCFKIGLASLMAQGTSVKGKKRAQNLGQKIVELLLRGWK